MNNLLCLILSQILLKQMIKKYRKNEFSTMYAQIKKINDKTKYRKMDKVPYIHKYWKMDDKKLLKI